MKYSIKLTDKFLLHLAYITNHPVYSLLANDINICHDRAIFPEHYVTDKHKLEKLIKDKVIFTCANCGGKQSCHKLMK